jgi:hypothetical protein
MELSEEDYCYELKDGSLLEIKNDFGFLTFIVLEDLTSIFLGDITRLSGKVINREKDSYSIFIHSLDGEFFQIDNMLCFNKENYETCYKVLSDCLTDYHKQLNGIE